MSDSTFWIILASFAMGVGCWYADKLNVLPIALLLTRADEDGFVVTKIRPL
jgi:hypothetical protein